MPIHRRLVSGGWAILLSYPRHVSSSQLVRRPLPDTAYARKVVRDEIGNRPSSRDVSITSSWRHLRISPPLPPVTATSSACLPILPPCPMPCHRPSQMPRHPTVPGTHPMMSCWCHCKKAPKAPICQIFIKNTPIDRFKSFSLVELGVLHVLFRAFLPLKFEFNQFHHCRLQIHRHSSPLYQLSFPHHH